MNCKDCRFYTPQYHQIGHCTRPEVSGSKFFSVGDAKLIVHQSHGCGQFELPPSTESETL